MILEPVAWVTVEVVDLIAHVVLLISHMVLLIAHVVLLITQITVTRAAMTLVPVTHHTTERISTAMVRVASMTMLVTSAVTRQGARAWTDTGRGVKLRRQKGDRMIAVVPSYKVNCASFHKYDIRTVVL